MSENPKKREKEKETEMQIKSNPKAYRYMRVSQPINSLICTRNLQHMYAHKLIEICLNSTVRDNMV